MQKVAGLLALFTWCVVGTALAAAPAARDRGEEATIEAALAGRDPALAQKFRAATEALDTRRLPEAAAGFEAVLARSPRHAASLRRLSYVESARGNAERAVQLARAALEVEPGWDGKYALAMALQLTRQPEALIEAGGLAEELFRERPDEKSAGVLAEVSLARENLPGLERAVRALLELDRDGLSANYYGAVYHLLREELDDADRLLRRAEAAGLPAAVAASLRERGGINQSQRRWHLARLAGWALGAWLLGLGLIFVLGRGLSRMALTAIDRAQGSDDLLQRTARLRRIYARVLAFAAIYYYVSIPVLLVIVLGGAGSLVYGLLLLGHIPAKLLLLIVVGALASAWALVRSLLHRSADPEPPGRRIGPEDEPALWAVLREVAARVGTRPVDAVYLTPGTEVAVSERGPVRARLADRGQRYLLLGAGVLPGFSRQSFQAVLAHEYGHFSNRDTAGGGLARTVQGSLLRTLVALAERGGLLIINPAWHFMRVFYAMFLRIDLGASRVHEVMADRFAALTYGPRAFVEGLTHVIRRSVAFEHAAGQLIKQVEKSRRALSSLYQAPVEGNLTAAELDRAVEKALSDPGSPFDSHPPPRRRIEWTLRLPEPPGNDGPAAGDAWELFAGRAALEAEMTRLVNARLEQEGAIESGPPTTGAGNPEAEDSPPPPGSP